MPLMRGSNRNKSDVVFTEMKSVLYKIDIGKKAAAVITNEHKCTNSDGVYENNVQNSDSMKVKAPQIRKLCL